MKALILHANEYLVHAESPSTRIGDCEPEEWLGSDDNTGEGPPRPLKQAFVAERMEECLVVFFQVEEGDTEVMARSLCRYLKKCAKQFKTQRVMVAPFAHLSGSHPDPEIAKDLSSLVFKLCEKWNVNGHHVWEIGSSHWGWNKSLKLDVKGHLNAFKHWSSTKSAND
ncbi:MAG: Threonine-tRNA ligase [Parcubacteria group bacterium GW2011_GWA2_43_17]|nr:MAG: Threonine-tRNA ligase [Parcubacteria group bacterium GW2011_GWA2_43_17]KKT91219.1 MAG: Threonine-tRNA ligase [Parcubacteria group bacterium GW2011_GWF2_45_11]OGY94746.1 MAG: hypothetical protein A2260_00910 [Candidatus Komeilibacteria bacterium RIFOXYA2_FULL_45_9]HAH04271.1 hypothetical protein [Candidatus Komeilibacteria bacterium]